MCEKEIFGKSRISYYEVENDRAKFVNGLGMTQFLPSDKSDHIPPVEVGVPATGCLRHH